MWGVERGHDGGSWLCGGAFLENIQWRQPPRNLDAGKRKDPASRVTPGEPFAGADLCAKINKQDPSHSQAPGAKSVEEPRNRPLA